MQINLKCLKINQEEDPGGETAANVEILTFKPGIFTEGHQRPVNRGCPHAGHLRFTSHWCPE